MYLENYIYRMDDKLPVNFCDEIIDFSLEKSQVVATVGGLSKDKMYKKEGKKVRNSHVVWLNEPWIYEELWPLVHEANKNAKWNFKLTDVEPLQFTKYVGSLNQHYDWHTDSGKGPHAFRKLSFVLQLSDPKSYVGGQFLINPSRRWSKKDIRFDKSWENKGSIIFFPSFLEHAVTPVILGTRYSLVGWLKGPLFT
mgnify:FL=1